MRVRTASTMGAVIRSRRRELNLSQEHLARRIGATRQWLIAIERGKDTAEIGMVLRALAALGLALDVQPGNTRAEVVLDIKPLPVIDIDAIVDANVGRHIDLVRAKAPHPGCKATETRPLRKGKRRS